MNSLEYANKILQEFRRGKKVEKLVRGDLPLEMILICTDGSTERVHGYWAHEISSRMDEEKSSEITK